MEEETTELQDLLEQNEDFYTAIIDGYNAMQLMEDLWDKLPRAPETPYTRVYLESFKQALAIGKEALQSRLEGLD